MNFISKTGVLLVLIAFYVPAASAQRTRNYDHGRVGVLDRGSHGFLVNVQDDNGTSPEHAGLKAMEWACKISLERGFSHMGVGDFRTGTASVNVQTSEARADYAQDINGRYVESGTRPAQVETRTRGTASLGVILMNEGVASNMADSMQIVNASSCTVVN